MSFGEQRAVLPALPAAVLPGCSQGCPAAGYAAQSLLAAIGSVQFVSNLVFAATVLKDTIPARIVLATALIVAGNLLLVVFGSKESPDFTARELAALYRTPGMVLYMSLAFGFGRFTHIAATPSGHHIEHPGSPCWLSASVCSDDRFGRRTDLCSCLSAALPVSWTGYRCGQSLKAKGILPKPWAKLLPILYSIYSSESCTLTVMHLLLQQG